MDSLHDLLLSCKSKFGKRFIVRADAAWFGYLHKRSYTDAPQHFKELFSHIDRLARKQDKSHPCMDVSSFVQIVVINAHPGIFMAPMCSPFTKVTAKQLANAERPYWVTEKSDGLRVIFVSYLVENFPRWNIANGNPNGENFIDTCQLELGYCDLDQNADSVESCQLRLTIGVCTLKRLPAPPSGAASQRFILTKKRTNESDVEMEVLIVRSMAPRHFSYLFDRAMDGAYLLTDEYVFNRVSCVVLDGELMASLTTPPSPMIGVFDVFAYTDYIHGGAPQEITLLNRAPMSERYAIIKDLILNECFYTSGTAPHALKIFRKQMYDMKVMDECLKHISIAPGDYVFAGGPLGPTRNDGLIFTPESFDIVSGSCASQLKWKWPELLTVDWRVEKLAMPQGRFRFEMYFKKRQKMSMPDIIGHSEYSRSEKLIVAPTMVCPETAAVAECSFDTILRAWKLVKFRTDKTDANSIVTIISVLESQCEAISLKVLVGILGGNVSEPSSTALPPTSVTAMPNSAEPVSHAADASPSSCTFLLRATSKFAGGVDLTLQFCVKLKDVKNVLWCNHRQVTQCFGLGEPCPEEDPSSQLESKLHIALANAGGSQQWSDFTCTARFDPACGRWEILTLSAKGASKSLAFGAQVITYLMQLAVKLDRIELDESASAPKSLEGPTSVAAETRRIGGGAATDSHYASRTKLLGHGSDRSNLRQYNNWVKSILIHNAVTLVRLERVRERTSYRSVTTPPIAVLDLCCGRGGDLQKWKNYNLKHLMMVDSCFEAVAEAAARYSVAAGLSTKIEKGRDGHPGVPATFVSHDCFSADLTQTISQTKLASLDGASFDVVSCQFSMHYAFASESGVRGFMTNVSEALAVGGIFVGTTVHDEILLRHLRQAADAAASPQQPKNLTFGNKVYSVTLARETVNGILRPCDDPQGRYGESYSIRFEESVDDAEEYIVRWKQFVAMCEKDFRLRLIEDESFCEMGHKHENSEVGQKLMTLIATGKRDRNSEMVQRISLTAEEYEASNIYRAFIMQKI